MTATLLAAKLNLEGFSWQRLHYLSQACPPKEEDSKLAQSFELWKASAKGGGGMLSNAQHQWWVWQFTYVYKFLVSLVLNFATAGQMEHATMNYCCCVCLRAFDMKPFNVRYQKDLVECDDVN